MEGVNALENFADDRVVVVPNEKHGLTLNKDRAAYVKGDNIQRMNETAPPGCFVLPAIGNLLMTRR